MSRKRKIPSDGLPPEEEKKIADSGKPRPPIPTPTQADTDAEQDDLLAEARRALIEEQSQTETKPGLLKKVTGRLIFPKKAKAQKDTGKLAPETPPQEIIAQQQPETPSRQESPAPEEASSQQETESILDVLKKAESNIAEEAPEPLPEKNKADILPPAPAGQLKIPPPATDSEASIEYRDLRNIALEGYQEPSPEAFAPPPPTMDEKIENLAGRVKYRTLVWVTIGSLTAVICLALILVGSLTLPLRALLGLRPTPTPTVLFPTAPPPAPMQVRLPGGWSFILGKGNVVNGSWSPAGPEWLEGTDICRWVSLPWSKELEAVFATIKPGDIIELDMTNYDRWLYRVRSVQYVSTNQLTGLDQNRPSLLLILTKTDSDIRVVILATQ